MKRYRKWVAAIATVALGLGLAGCGDDGNTDVRGFTVETVTINGRPLLCVRYDGGSYDSGLSCDWDGWRAKR